MEQTDMPKFAVLMARMGAHYSKTITEFIVEDYWQALKAFSLLQIEKAFLDYLQDPDKNFMPTTNQLIRLILGSHEDKALNAWTDVLMAIQKYGAYQSVAFDDPIIHAVIQILGGWIQICRIKIDQQPYYAERFRKHYLVLLKNPPPKALLPSCLSGILHEPPVRIGQDKSFLLVPNLTDEQSE